MNNVSPFVTKQDIQEQASLWISRLDRGLNEQETIELQQWVASHEENHKQLLKMAAFWDNLTVLNELSALFPLDTIRKSPPKRAKRLAIAASFAIAALLTASLVTDSHLLPSLFQPGLYQSQTLTTNVGQQNTFTLSDGSTIVLNTNSQLVVDFSPTHRKLNLLAGEANFELETMPLPH